MYQYHIAGYKGVPVIGAYTCKHDIIITLYGAAFIAVLVHAAPGPGAV